MTIEQKQEQALALAKIKYSDFAYAALWGSALVFLTEEQLEKIINVLEVK